MREGNGPSTRLLGGESKIVRGNRRDVRSRERGVRPKSDKERKGREGAEKEKGWKLC